MDLLPVCVVIHAVTNRTGTYDKLLKTRNIKSDDDYDSLGNSSCSPSVHVLDSIVADWTMLQPRDLEAIVFSTYFFIYRKSTQQNLQYRAPISHIHTWLYQYPHTKRWKRGSRSS